MNTKLKLYLGHKLTKASEEFLASMALIRSEIERTLGDEWEVLKFLGVTAGTRTDVYDKDIETNVAECDLFVAIVDEESTGLGIEIATALFRFNTPILIVYTAGARVSRLVGGMVDRNPHLMMEKSIGNPADIGPHLAEAIDRFEILKYARMPQGRGRATKVIRQLTASWSQK